MKRTNILRIVQLWLVLLTSLSAKSQTLSIPHLSNFDTGLQGWTFSSSSPATNWQLGFPTTAPTNSCHSGVFCMDVNLDSIYQSNANCMLVSPDYNISGLSGIKLGFWHNYDSEGDWDGSRIEYSVDSGATWLLLGFYQDPNSTNWYNYANLNSSNLPGWAGVSGGWVYSTYKLKGLNTSKIRLRFIFTSDTSIETIGYSVDDFQIDTLPQIDASIESLVTPLNGSQSGQNTNISFKIKNVGLQTLTNINCKYQLNSNPIVSQNFILPNLLVDSTITLSFTTPILIPSGGYNLKIFTSDANKLNDTLNLNLLGFSTLSVPYFNDFENGNNDWVNQTIGNPLSNWELGTPNFGVTNSTYSGIKCWDINLNSAYTENAESYLESQFYDFSPINLPQISFYYNINSEAGWDGLRVDYLDSTGIWKVLGTFNDPNSQNWYNEPSLNSSSLPGIGGNSTGWKKAYYNISSIGSFKILKFRFAFNSDPSVQRDGVSIDDVKIYNPLSSDMEALAFKPANNSVMANTNLDIKFHLKSNGYTSLTAFVVKYKIDNGPINTLPINLALNFNDTATISLVSLNLPPGAYTIKAWVDLPGDLDHSNDTIQKLYNFIPLFTPRYTNDFEVTTLDFQSLSLGNMLSKWELGMPNYGTCNSTHSGINCWDVNLNTSPYPNDTCYLYSPFLNLTNTTVPKISFWQNRNIQDSKLKIEYELNNNGVWQNLGILNDPNGTNWYSNNFGPEYYWSFSSNGWIQSSYDLTNYISSSIIRIRFVYLGSFQTLNDGVSIDDFEFTQVYANDASTIGVIIPGADAVAGINNNLEITLKNSGYANLTNTLIRYQLNNGQIVSYNWNGNLAYNTTTTVSLPTFNPNIGINTLKIYTDYTNDANRFNDTLIYSFNGLLAAPLPYFENFDNTINTWNPSLVGLPYSNWELGTPNYSTTNSTYSGSNCWDINLTSPYGNLAVNYLYSPIFTLQNAITSQLNFWLNYNTELAEDGLRLEYSTNGFFWQVLGSLNDANASNWYNNNINTQNKPGWTGNSGGWINASYLTNFLNGSTYLRFRFVFTSDFSFSGVGVSVDDFSVSQTVSLNEIENKLDWHIYPNPTSDILNLVSGINITNSKISIHDVLGKEVFNSSNVNLNARELFTINTSEFAAGLYSISIMQKEKIQVVKFIKN